MQSFFQIVKFEYKKILSKKLTKISLLLFLITLIFTTNNELFIHTTDMDNNKLSLYEINKLSNVNEKSEIYIDTETLLKTKNLISSGIKKNEELLKNEHKDRNIRYTKYFNINYAKPYATSLYFVLNVLNPYNQKDNIEYITTLEKEDFDNIYNKRTELLEEKVENLSIIQKEKIFELNSKIKIPFYYEKYETYEKFLKDIQLFMMFIIYIIISCISPIFSNDYSNKTYYIISPTKYGKCKLIYAKIFVALSFSILLTLFTQIFSFLNLCLLYGTSGFNTSIQIMYYDYLTPYPITIGQFFIIKFIINILVSIMVTIIACLISSYAKSPFISIIISFVILFIPTYTYSLTDILNVENPITNFIRNIILLHPINLIGYMSLLINDMFTIFNKSFELYYIVPIVFIPISIIFIFLCIKSAKSYKLK